MATAFLDKIEIRDAGAMGKGVFATQNIEEVRMEVDLPPSLPFFCRLGWAFLSSES